MQVISTNTVPIIAALRDAWALNGVTTSFAQLMGLPAGQLSDTYLFPAYNNVTLNEQLRIGNVDTSDSIVTVTIGGVLKGTYPLGPNESTRVNYAGVDSGPVIVQGTPGVHIIAAIRDSWSANGLVTSFVQLMGLPASQVSDTYLFPAYNNVTLNEQLRIGNVDTKDTTVTVTIGGVLKGTYPLGPNASTRVNYAGVDSGPVIVQGTSGVHIIAAIRDSWSSNGVVTSFAQLMGLPSGQLSNSYIFPAYNNITLNEQLRIGNVDASDTIVTVTIGGVLKGTYPLGPNESTRVNYAGVDSGPVVVQGSPGVHIIAAIRDSWKANGVVTSFVQLMGMPAGELSDTYVFPAYNNVTLNEQLRIGNVDTSDTIVTVTIGGVLKGTYPLGPNESTRVNYAGVDSGPVIVQGTPGVHIIAAIRDSWSANGKTTSFVQLMGMPASQLSDIYVFPAYNNVTLNEQLRIGNVDTSDTIVTVTIGGVLKGTYPLGPNESTRVNYAGVDSGPVIVQGTPGVHIIAAIRDSWKANGVVTSFAQLMGLPSGQLSDTYLFPAYNNVTLNEQLRIGNVDTSDTIVTVTIGGVLKGTYPLGPNASTRVNYAGVDSGPVIVQGTPGVNIIAAIRDSWKAGAPYNTTTSFIQLMGLPSGQLSDTYLFPAYNNVTLNEQLRFGVP